MTRAILLFAMMLSGCREKAQVGAPCEGPKGCVEGADCMASYTGVVPIGATRGICYQRCVVDSACPTGQRCFEMHCMSVAGIGQSCGGGSPCEPGTGCVNGADGSWVCRRKCLLNMDCEQDESCVPVASQPPRPLGHEERFCLRVSG